MFLLLSVLIHLIGGVKINNEFIEEPEDIETVLGSTLIFRCRIKFVGSTQVTWCKNDFCTLGKTRELLHYRRYRIIGDIHRGLFLMKIINFYGEIVRRHISIERSHFPSRTVDRKRGSRAILRCWVNGMCTTYALLTYQYSEKSSCSYVISLQISNFDEIFPEKSVLPLTFTEKIDFSISIAQRNFPTREVYCEGSTFSGCFYPNDTPLDKILVFTSQNMKPSYRTMKTFENFRRN